MVKKLSCVSCGSLKRFLHTFTTARLSLNSTCLLPPKMANAERHLLSEIHAIQQGQFISIHKSSLFHCFISSKGLSSYCLG